MISLPVDNLRVFSGNSNRGLARAICEILGRPLGAMEVSRFADGECRIKIEENVRGCDVFMLQSTCPPVNEHLVELLLMVDAARRASASRVTAVVPYFGYARQDRKDEPRVPISAKLVANLLVAAGANRILTVDLHVDQIQGFFDIPVDNLYAAPVLAEEVRRDVGGEAVVVSPDPGAVERAMRLGARLGWPLAIIDKRRPRPNVAEVLHIIGEVEGKTAVIVDDMIDTAGTLAAVSKALREVGGARDVRSVATHAVFSGPALDRIRDSAVSSVVVTDTIPIRMGQGPHEPSRVAAMGQGPHEPGREAAAGGGKVRVLSLAPLLAEAMKRIHSNESVSSLFT